MTSSRKKLDTNTPLERITDWKQGGYTSVRVNTCLT